MYNTLRAPQKNDSPPALELISLPRRPLIRAQYPLDVGLHLLNSSLLDLVGFRKGERARARESACWRSRTRGGTRRLTSHLETGSDFGELHFLVRGLDEDVMAVVRKHVRGLGRVEDQRDHTYRNEMKSPSLTKVIVRLLSSLRAKSDG
jgi:hypothetical protein